ncbi:MAG: LysM peptidoglycan-binding domain-containing protein [Kineosporiaceae bacterium]
MVDLAAQRRARRVAAGLADQESAQVRVRVPDTGEGRPRGSKPAGPLVLTRRGRVVVRVAGAVVVAVLAAMLLVVGSLGAQADDEARPAASRVHVVMPGETLWAIARQEAPGRDPQEVALRLAEVNRLDGTSLQVGQRLLVPLGY